MVGISGRLLDPLGAGDAERAQLPAADQRQPGRHDREAAIDAPGDQVGIDRRGAAIGHVREVDLGQVLEQLAAHVRRTAVAGRRERHLAGVLSWPRRSGRQPS